jgi:hypothetical protein
MMGGTRAIRRASVWIVTVFVASACAGSSGGSVVPSISIESAEVNGQTVALIVTAGEAGAPATISVAWGDGTREPDVEGIGEFAYAHTYGTDVTAANVTVTAEAGGVVASDVVRVEFDDPAPTTTIVALDTTTIVVDTTTTSTTEPPSTTTTSESTTTTSTTTVPTTTTTTTVPVPVYIEASLDVGSGKIVTRWGDGIKESKWDGRTAEVHVKRHDDSWEEDGIKVSFPIPMALYEDHLAGRTRALFDFTAYVSMDYELDSDKSDGNQARLEAKLTGNRFYGWAGETLRESIGADDNITVVRSGTFSGSWDLASAYFDIPQDIDFTLECKAKGPGGALVTSDSQCDAEFRIDRIDVRITIE